MKSRYLEVVPIRSLSGLYEKVPIRSLSGLYEKSFINVDLGRSALRFSHINFCLSPYM